MKQGIFLEWSLSDFVTLECNVFISLLPSLPSFPLPSTFSSCPLPSTFSSCPLPSTFSSYPLHFTFLIPFLPILFHPFLPPSLPTLFIPTSQFLSFLSSSIPSFPLPFLPPSFPSFQPCSLFSFKPYPSFLPTYSLPTNLIRPTLPSYYSIKNFLSYY